MIQNIHKADLSPQTKQHRTALEDDRTKQSHVYALHSSLITQQRDGFEHGENLFPGALGAAPAVAHPAVAMCPLHSPGLSCF